MKGFIIHRIHELADLLDSAAECGDSAGFAALAHEQRVLVNLLVDEALS